MKASPLITLLLLNITLSFSQDNIQNWVFQSDGKVFSHIDINDQAIYFGNDSGSFYSIDLESGNLNWQYKTDFPIRSKAITAGNKVFFSAGNNVYALDKTNGKLKWSFQNTNLSHSTPIDFWDYHFGIPAAYESIVYFGLGDGILRGFNMENGAIELEFTTRDSVPIRGGILIENNILFFGDWDGRIYAIDLENNSQIWTYKTFGERPYVTFGAQNTQLASKDKYLVLSGRNRELQIINKNTGEFIWKYEDPNGGWISGDPMISGDTLYVGASDNHEMFAFDISNGDLFWKYRFTNNCFSGPVKFKGNLIFATGDAYSYGPSDDGIGYLYVLDQNSGQLKNLKVFKSNLYSTPLIREGQLIIAEENGQLNSLNVEKIISEEFNAQSIGYKAFEFTPGQNSPFKIHTPIKYKVNYSTELSVGIYDLEDNPIKILDKAKYERGNFEVQWSGENEKGEKQGPGYYFVKIQSGNYYLKTYLIIEE